VVSETAEMFLKVIHGLAAGGDARVRTSEIAQRMALAPATVTEMLQRLGEEGYLDYERYHGVRLTDTGERVAHATERRFRLMSRFFSELLGLRPTVAEEVACRMEHALTHEVELRLCELLGIEHGEDPADMEARPPFDGASGETRVIPLSRLAPGARARVRAVIEPTGFTTALAGGGRRAGVELTLAARDDGVCTVELANARLTIDESLARHIILERLD